MLFPIDFPSKYTLNPESMNKELKEAQSELDEELQQFDVFADDNRSDLEEIEEEFADARLKVAYKHCFDELTREFRE